MLETIGGIALRANDDGLVIWCADWNALFEMARKRENGLRIRAGNPATFGQTDVLIERKAEN